MLFTLPAVQAEISKVLRSWFAKQKRLEPVFNLFFGLLYNRDIELDVRFLLYAQAVETYGYRRGRNPVERPRSGNGRRMALGSRRPTPERETGRARASGRPTRGPPWPSLNVVWSRVP